MNKATIGADEKEDSGILKKIKPVVKGNDSPNAFKYIIIISGFLVGIIILIKKKKRIF